MKTLLVVCGRGHFVVECAAALRGQDAHGDGRLAEADHLRIGLMRVQEVVDGQREGQPYADALRRFADGYDLLVVMQRRGVHIHAVTLSEPILDGGDHAGVLQPVAVVVAACEQSGDLRL